MASAGSPHVICTADALVEGGAGVRFAVRTHRDSYPAFAVRYRGAVHADVNRCAHRALEIDWEPGRFYDAAGGRHLVCATHGALYEPDTGRCAAGPCSGGLAKLPAFENNGFVYLAADAAVKVRGD